MGECKKHPDAKFSKSGKCRSCNREYQAVWFSANRAEQNTRVRANAERARDTNRRMLWEYLLQHPCVDCGNSDRRVLEADHIQDKRKSIARLIMNASWETVLAELARCEIRCANCHRIKTFERAGTWRHVAHGSPGHIPSLL